MIHRINISKDATLYADSVTQNTGADEIIEINKTITEGEVNVNLNSRILIQFPIEDIKTLITDGVITSNRKFYLNLYVTEPKAIPGSFNLAINPVSGSWVGGLGKRFESTLTTNGVNWRTKDYLLGTEWVTSSFAPGSDGFFQSEPGGGNWYITPTVNHLVDVETKDISVDVTSIVEEWISDNIPNNGFIVRRDDIAESDSILYGNLQFFSGETHTIYEPKLEVRWEDFSFTTGSLEALDVEDAFLYLPELRREYKTNSKVKVRVVGRERYPQRNFSSFNKFTTNQFLPSSSFWSVRDALSEDIVIPFDEEYTKISCDSKGNFFNFWTHSLEPERLYRFVFKVEQPNGEVEYFDNNFMFKVVR